MHGNDFSALFYVRIIEDYRMTPNPLDGKYGICLGLYAHPSTRIRDPVNGVPLILSNGQYIWASDCWYTQVPGVEIAPMVW